MSLAATTCRHEQTTPVESNGEVVAHLCTDCDEQLHAGWGCDDCHWESAEVRRLCDVEARLMFSLVAPCRRHRA